MIEVPRTDRGMVSFWWWAGAWRWANSTGRCAAPYLATTDDRWGVPGLRQAYVAHGMCGGLCQGWGCCEARGVAQPQDGSGEARGEGEGEGELSSDGDSDRSAGDPVWGSAALEDEWRAASLARQAVGDAAYAAAHAAGASRAEACDAAVRAVRVDVWTRLRLSPRSSCALGGTAPAVMGAGRGRGRRPHGIAAGGGRGRGRRRRSQSPGRIGRGRSGRRSTPASLTTRKGPSPAVPFVVPVRASLL